MMQMAAGISFQVTDESGGSETAKVDQVEVEYEEEGPDRVSCKKVGFYEII